MLTLQVSMLLLYCILRIQHGHFLQLLELSTGVSGVREGRRVFQSAVQYREGGGYSSLYNTSIPLCIIQYSMGRIFLPATPGFTLTAFAPTFYS